MSTTAPTVQLPGVSILASDMFSITLTIPLAVMSAGNGVVQAAMYGQLLAAYTPSAGPSAGTQMSTDQWVYYTGTDYAAVSGSVPAFATFSDLDDDQTMTFTLPNVIIQASHIVFGLETIPTIPVTSANQPQQPNPATTPGVYDFVEFTFNADRVLYINTTMIDQLGVPIQIQIDPPATSLPAGAGVYLDRATVFSDFYAQAPAAFAQCAQDAFGQPQTTRIFSPGAALAGNGVQGVVANTFTGPTSTLAAGTYYYAVSALNAAGNEGYVQSTVVQATVSAKDSVNVAWAPTSSQPAGTASYNVYRGTPSGDGSVTWGLLGNVAADTFSFGGSFADSGQATTDTQPRLNPLATDLDAQIQAFFGRFKQATLTLTATDGTSDGFVYTFSGTTVADSSGTPQYLQLKLASVTSGGTSVSNPPIPIDTPFNIYYPFWSTNTFNTANPAPPAWALYTNVPASMMVFAAQGVFADNAQQAASNLPSGVSAANAAIYSTLLGGLENQVVAAITRGIANLTTLSPQNWGNGTAPTQIAPTLASGGSLTAGTAYYYVVTAVNAQGETIGSLEFSATPTAGQQSVQVNWMPMSTATTSFNVYRGTAPGQENVRVGSVSNTSGTASSFVDTGAAGTAGAPPAYFPAGVPSDWYDWFFHQSSISINGAAYAAPYDDQGGQSSTLSTASPTSVSITLGPWSS